MVKICLAVALVLVAGCSDGSPPRRYTVTTHDGQVFHGAKWRSGGTGYDRWDLPDGRVLHTEGNHSAVEERPAEEENR